MAEEQGGIDFTMIKTDPLQAEMMAAGREALRRIAASLPAPASMVGPGVPGKTFRSAGQKKARSGMVAAAGGR